eukprot:CAMPEP_0194224360 /NCGR_PEP_ID=MMETSP0156-20130528/37264_1 /TAXON_ID=33649 /ORGANISM="Thalassionema nitzschioides, Strain L26-B" /LENGTH=183 /DNA_ID=CAMNT_0038955891 /DNA_START=444 /DNA_END=991 /DNA_ORIENTATION=+
MDVPLLKKYNPETFCDVHISNSKMGCPGCHHPYKATDDEGTHHFTMLRDPLERLRSAYSFNRHLSKLKDPNITFETYVNEPHIPDCQLKMILGHHCFDMVEPDSLNMSLALERISSPRFFFGDTGRWNESICLFHKWYGGSPRDFELLNNRPTKKRSSFFNDADYDFKETVFFNKAMTIFNER